MDLWWVKARRVSNNESNDQSSVQRRARHRLENLSTLFREARLSSNERDAVNIGKCMSYSKSEVSECLSSSRSGSATSMDGFRHLHT